MAAKRIREDMTLEQKQWIIQYAEKNPGKHNKIIADQFNQQFSRVKPLDRRRVGDVLRKKEEIMSRVQIGGKAQKRLRKQNKNNKNNISNNNIINIVENNNNNNNNNIVENNINNINSNGIITVENQPQILQQEVVIQIQPEPQKQNSQEKQLFSCKQIPQFDNQNLNNTNINKNIEIQADQNQQIQQTASQQSQSPNDQQNNNLQLQNQQNQQNLFHNEGTVVIYNADGDNINNLSNIIDNNLNNLNLSNIQQNIQDENCIQQIDQNGRLDQLVEIAVQESETKKGDAVEKNICDNVVDNISTQEALELVTKLIAFVNQKSELYNFQQHLQSLEKLKQHLNQCISCEEGSLAS